MAQGVVLALPVLVLFDHGSRERTAQ